MAASCFDKACELLARRPHFRAELERKLRQRGHDHESIGETLERLDALGYLDDLACASSLASGPLRRRGYGPRRVRMELARRGAPPESVEAAVAAAFPDGEEAAARKVADRWLSGRGGDAAALGRHLGRKGFSTAVVMRVLEDLAG